MVPVKLYLSNFTSYGTDVPTLDFTKFHMAAISGQNGAGKSSLLDSITWCLWGTSRLGDSSDQLVRLGQNQMFVEFSFELDGHVFTVKRARALRGGGTTGLEFWSNSHHLAEGTIKATQQKIIDTLHLSYETFTNSAFLRQGHADEFTTKGPTDRKRILADILGLANYDLLEEKAKEKAKETQTKIQLLDYQLLEIEAELSQKEEREKQLSEAQEKERQVKKELEEVEKDVKIIDSERESLCTRLQSLQESQARIKTALEELTDLKIKISEAEAAQEKYQQVLSQKEEIKSCYLQLQKAREEEKALNIRRSELIKVKDELVAIQQALLTREKKRDEAVSKLKVDKKELQTKIDEKQSQNDHLSKHKDTCPTCGQTIGEDKNKEIIAKNDEKIATLQSQIKELENKITAYQYYVFPEAAQAKEKAVEVSTLEDETKNYSQVTKEVSELSKFEPLQAKLQEAEIAVTTQQTTIVELKKVFQNRQQQIERDQQSLTDLEKIESQLSEVKNHLATREQIRVDLSHQISDLSTRVGEARQLVSRTAQLSDLFEKKKAEKTAFQKDKEAFDELALAFGKKGIQAMIIETAIPEVEDEANRLLDRLTEGRMKVRFETQKETKTKVNGEHGIVETLDINISDEMGERPYEAYSGGEQFRVNFAIRLALSKLLTHRAGAKLQFLVIDEGFGTQDTQGRSRIVEAMDAIKDDFEKILIITHLEELKEEFPVRIEVQKGPGGSTFEVVGV